MGFFFFFLLVCFLSLNGLCWVIAVLLAIALPVPMRWSIDCPLWCGNSVKENCLTILVTGAVLDQPSSRIGHSGVGTSSGATGWVILMLLLPDAHLAPGLSCSPNLYWLGVLLNEPTYAEPLVSSWHLDVT